MEIRTYSQWNGDSEFDLLNISLHNCGHCFGIDFALFGLQIGFRMQ